MQTGKEPEVEIRDSLVHGVVGGLLAGALAAVWFLVVDLSAGEPLRTPSALGSALFGAQDATRLGGPVALYTVLHFATFAALGLATALFLRSTGLTPGWMLGVVFGIVVLNGVHYVGLLVADQALLGVLPWPHVVGANLAAGVGLMTYLHRTAGASGPLGPETLRYHPILLEGLEVGL
ncbi:MAG: hypothetical protein ACRELC_01855, partial [Gemmatimonadota bacterium]